MPLGELLEAARPRVSPRDADGLRFIGMNHVESQTMRLLGTVPASTMKSAAVRFEAGDVLYGRLRPYLNKVYRPNFRGLGSAEFIVLTPSNGLDGGYLAYLLSSADFVRFATRLNTGDRPRVDFKQLRDYLVPLPQVEEQQRIVAAIEQQLTRVDAAARSFQGALAKLRRYRISVLSDVVSPDSAEQWRWATVGELATRIQYGTSAKAADKRDGVPVLRMGNIVDGELSIERLKYLPADHAEFPGLLLLPGDVLFNRTNSPELVGKSAVYRGWPSPCSFASYLVRVQLGPDVLPEFLAQTLNGPFGRRWIASVVSQQVGQANVSGSKLKAFRIPVPPLVEQQRLVQLAESRLVLLDESQSAIRSSLLRAQSLRHAILRLAFAGGLSRT